MRTTKLILTINIAILNMQSKYTVFSDLRDHVSVNGPDASVCAHTIQALISPGMLTPGQHSTLLSLPETLV